MHIAGQENDTTDYPSRELVTVHEWSINMGPTSINLFTLAENAKCPKYCSIAARDVHSQGEAFQFRWSMTYTTHPSHCGLDDGLSGSPQRQKEDWGKSVPLSHDCLGGNGGQRSLICAEGLWFVLKGKEKESTWNILEACGVSFPWQACTEDTGWTSLTDKCHHVLFFVGLILCKATWGQRFHTAYLNPFTSCVWSALPILNRTIYFFPPDLFHSVFYLG